MTSPCFPDKPPKAAITAAERRNALHPILVTIAGKPIHFYQVAFPGSILLGIVLASRRAKKEGMKEETILTMFIFVILGLVIGARLLDVLANFKWYMAKPARFFNRETGVVMLGGYIGAIAGGWAYLRFKRLPFLPVVDICATYFGLSLAVHRTFACFMAGCCYGAPTRLPWGVVFPVGSIPYKAYHDLPLHPTQLYEALLGLVIFFSLIAYRRRKRVPGELFALQLVIYGAGRFLVEFVRGDGDRGSLGPFSTSHFESRHTSSRVPRGRARVTETPAMISRSLPSRAFIWQIFS